MSVPTTPPPFRKPGFALRHVYAEAVEAGEGTLAVVNETTTDPTSRLVDSLQGPRVSFATTAGAAGAGWIASRTSQTDRVPVDLIALLGTNWYRQAALVALESATPAVAGPIVYRGGASPINELGAPGAVQWLDRVGDTAHPDGVLESDVSALTAGPRAGAHVTEALGLGELYASQVLEPVNGIAHSWIYGDEGNLLTSKTQGSATYTTVRGPAIRVYSLEVEKVPADELALWQAIVDAINDGRTFVYLPPEQGRWVSPRIITDDLAEWQPSPPDGVLSLGTGHDPTGPAQSTTSIVHTPTNLVGKAGRSMISTPLAFPNGPEDWSRKWLAIDVVSNDWSWLIAATAELYVVAFSNVQASGGFNQQTSYDLSPFFSGFAPVDDTWYRALIDLRDHPVVFNNAAYPVDLTAVDALQIVYQPSLNTQTLEICNVDLVDPKASPAFVTGSARPIEQDSNSPLLDPTYSVRIAMEETIA